MEHRSNNENNNPKSLGRIGYNTAFKNNFNLKSNFSSKNKKFAPRTPLKSKINIIEKPLPDFEDNIKKEDKMVNYPLLKSISSTNIHIQNKLSKSYNYDDKYNENALEDEPEDFMHIIEEKELFLENNQENITLKDLAKPKLDLDLINMEYYNQEENNQIVGAHFDDSGKKEFDDYFNSNEGDDF